MRSRLTLQAARHAASAIPMNAVIACGGTGGHLFPGLAVAEVLRARGHEVLLFVSEKEIDTLALSGRSEFRFEKLPTIGLPSPFSPAILGFRSAIQRKPFALPLDLPQIQSAGRSRDGRIHFHRAGPRRTDARHSDFHPRIERHSRQSEPPDRANGARGFARLQGMRAIFSQSANRSYRHADSDRTQADRSHRPRGKNSGCGEDLPTLLVMGGSQGASGINQAMIKSLPSLQARAAAGDSSFRRARRATGGGQLSARKYSGFRGRVSSSDGGSLQRGRFRDCARSGAASLAELAAFALPAILIPFPYAADDHQTRNAEIFVRADAAILVEGSGNCRTNCSRKKFVSCIDDPEQPARGCRKTRAKLAPKNAASSGRGNDGEIYATRMKTAPAELDLSKISHAGASPHSSDRRGRQRDERHRRASARARARRERIGQIDLAGDANGCSGWVCDFSRNIAREDAARRRADCLFLSDQGGQSDSR